MSEIFTAKDAAGAMRAGLAMAGNPAPKCTSWLGHKFEARYSQGTLPITKIGEIFDADAAVKVFEALAPKEYHHDICVRCGFVVEHKTDKSSS